LACRSCLHGRFVVQHGIYGEGWGVELFSPPDNTQLIENTKVPKPINPVKKDVRGNAWGTRESIAPETSKGSSARRDGATSPLVLGEVLAKPNLGEGRGISEFSSYGYEDHFEMNE